jgi:hypothetical protein
MRVALGALNSRTLRVEMSRDASDDVHPQRVVDDDGAAVEVFALPTDSASLEELLIGLFRDHWREIAFGPLIQGAAWEMRATEPPDRIKMFDGYLTVAFGVPHFHICIGEHKGPHNNRVSPALAKGAPNNKCYEFRVGVG